MNWRAELITLFVVSTLLGATLNGWAYLVLLFAAAFVITVAFSL